MGDEEMSPTTGETAFHGQSRRHISFPYHATRLGCGDDLRSTRFDDVSETRYGDQSHALTQATNLGLSGTSLKTSF